MELLPHKRKGQRGTERSRRYTVLLEETEKMSIQNTIIIKIMKNRILKMELEP
jgi:hypothetical protein